MFNKLKVLFENRCPKCNELLSSESNSVSLVKACSQGHYKEETILSLGVRIVSGSTDHDQ
ncbi:mevalonate pyrophosphate decarboxylase [Paenibacillus sp. DS2015]